MTGSGIDETTPDMTINKQANIVNALSYTDPKEHLKAVLIKYDRLGSVM
jgi:hypothetical protein